MKIYRFIAVAHLDNGDIDDHLDPFWIFVEGNNATNAAMDISPDLIINEANSKWVSTNWNNLKLSVFNSKPFATILPFK